MKLSFESWYIYCLVQSELLLGSQSTSSSSKWLHASLCHFTTWTIYSRETCRHNFIHHPVSHLCIYATHNIYNGLISLYVVCIYVCMYLCMSVCIYVCLYVSMYVCMYLCMYVCIYVCMYVCMSVCMSVTPDNCNSCQNDWLSRLINNPVHNMYNTIICVHIHNILQRHGKLWSDKLQLVDKVLKIQDI